MGGGRARLRLDPRLPAAGGRNLHHLHLSGRVRLFLRARSSGLLHPGLRLARVCDRLFPAAPGLELRRQHGLPSAADFFVRKYASPALGVLVSIVDLVALIPYLVLQLTGLGIIVTAAGYGAIPKDAAIWIGAAIVTVYAMMSGIRGSGYTAGGKDIGILGVVLFLGIYLPSHLYGGIGPMFEKIAAAKPGFLVFPASGQSVAWFISTVLLTLSASSCGRNPSPPPTRRRTRASSGAMRSPCRFISSYCCSCSSSASPRCCKCPA